MGGEESKESSFARRSKEILGGYPVSVATWGWEVDIGSLCYGQTQDIVVRTNGGIQGQPAVCVTLTYDHVGPGGAGGQRKFHARSISYPPNYHGKRLMDLEFNILRLQLVDVVYKAKQIYNSDKTLSRSMLSSLLSTYDAQNNLSQHKKAQDLLTDLRGQVTEAFEKDEYFNKWGRHYVSSLAGAHLHQQCTNFKDPGLQNYGGTLFQNVRDRIDDLFNSLP